MSTVRLAELPLDARELVPLMARAKELLRDAGFSWVSEVDVLTHFTPGSPKIDDSGSRCDRPVVGYSLAVALPANGLKLPEVCRCAQWFETTVVGCRLERDEPERMAECVSRGRCHVGRSELVFGPYRARQLRQL